MTNITLKLTAYEARALRKILATLGGAYSYHARTIELILDKLDEAETKPEEPTLKDLENIIEECFGIDDTFTQEEIDQLVELGYEVGNMVINKRITKSSELDDEEVDYLLSLKHDNDAVGHEHFKDGT